MFYFECRCTAFSRSSVFSFVNLFSKEWSCILYFNIVVIEMPIKFNWSKPW